MIKFFRHIRRAMIAENKFSKYLLYAIGEIILVVIGILIALQINNWNEENKQSKVEKTFLKRLQNDLQDNVANWHELIDKQNEKNKGVKAFIRFSLLQNKDSFPIVFPHFNTVLRWDDMTMNQVTYKEMQSSGKLDIIRSDSIKIKLLQLDQQYQKVFNRNASIKTGHEKYISDPSFKKLKYLDYVILDSSFSELHPRKYSGKELQKAFKDVQENIMNLVNDKVFMNSMIGSVYSHTMILGEMESAKNKAEELLALIDKELKR